MPISHQFKCIFVHIPKTAGTSITSMLGIDQSSLRRNEYNLYGIDNGKALQHLTAIDIRNLVGTNWFDEYYKFSFVRNPYDRFISDWAWFKKSNPFNRFGDNVIKTPELFFDKRHKLLDNLFVDHIIPQHEFIYNAGELLVDFVGKYEELDKDWEQVKSNIYFHHNIKLPDISLPTYQKTPRDNNWEYYYTKSLKKKVYKFYKKDFELFGYER